MGTSLSEVYDLFYQKVTDYRLMELYETSSTDFENYLESFLQFAIVDFGVCSQDLDYSDTTKEFPVTLTRKNKVILAMLMMKHWFQKSVNDVTQFQLHITDRDFKTMSEAMNLREKSIYLNAMKEELSQILVDYAYLNNDWDNWNNQIFSGS